MAMIPGSLRFVFLTPNSIRESLLDRTSANWREAVLPKSLSETSKCVRIVFVLREETMRRMPGAFKWLSTNDIWVMTELISSARAIPNAPASIKHIWLKLTFVDDRLRMNAEQGTTEFFSHSSRYSRMPEEKEAERSGAGRYFCLKYWTTRAVVSPSVSWTKGGEMGVNRE